MSEVNINGVPVHFPFQPYELQINYMGKVIECLQKNQNGILESPTGTGKTLSLLCSTLAWLELRKVEQRILPTDEANHENPPTIASKLQINFNQGWNSVRTCPRIIYSSRTHSQLTQAMKELKRTAYKHMKASVLGSRDQMCIHPNIPSDASNQYKTLMCQLRVKGRNCYFYNQVEHKVQDPDVAGQLLDLEDLVRVGKKRTFCPYYMSKEISKDADIIFVPYNYLLNSRTRRVHGLDLVGNVVIFDEAHNVEKMCEESASLDIRSSDIALCIDEVTQVMQKLSDITQSNLGSVENALMPEDFSPEDLCILKAIFLEFEKVIDEIDLSSGDEVVHPGGFIFDLLQKVDINPAKKPFLVILIDKLIQYLNASGTSAFQSKGAGLQKFSEFIKVVFNKDDFSYSHMESVKQSYKVHVKLDPIESSSSKSFSAPKTSLSSSKKRGKVISYWCFNPGFGMKELLDQGVHCVILTSGTLSPLDSFASELQISLPIQLENPHIVKPSQVNVTVLCRGPDGTALNSSYNNRNNPEYVRSLGLTIMNLSRVSPGGLLVFFPSYPLMKSCQDSWTACEIWAGIERTKPIFVECRTASGFGAAVKSFYEKVNDPVHRGACFFAVCRGKVSEGLDFANQNGRTVVVTGLPFPPLKDPRVVLKRQYLNEVLKKKMNGGLDGTMWYRLEAIRAVNQAIGRVIRHKDDFGSIVLCDNRFKDKSFANQLSLWVRPHIVIHDTFGSLIRDFSQFFRVAKSMFPDCDVPPKSLSQDSNSSSIKIKYDYSDCPDSAGKASANGLSRAFAPAPGRPVAHPPSSSSGSTSSANPLNPASSLLESISMYSENSNPVNTSTKSQENKQSLFSALEQKSSMIDFTSAPSSNQAHSSNAPEASLSKIGHTDAPKRKKIRIVRPAQKDLDAFVSDPQPKNESSTSQGTEEKKPAQIAKYIKEVKSTLSTGDYQTFSTTVKSYKTTRNLDQLISVLQRLFGGERKNLHLIKGFLVFCLPEHRPRLMSIFERAEAESQIRK